MKVTYIMDYDSMSEYLKTYQERMEKAEQNNMKLLSRVAQNRKCIANNKRVITILSISQIITFISLLIVIFS